MKMKSEIGGFIKGTLIDAHVFHFNVTFIACIKSHPIFLTFFFFHFPTEVLVGVHKLATADK